MTIKLKWLNTNFGNNDPSERGYWRTVEGRFDIGPNFNHSIYPSSYTVVDNLAMANANRVGLTDEQRSTVMNKGRRSFDTVRDCKEWATSLVARELEKQP